MKTFCEFQEIQEWLQAVSQSTRAHFCDCPSRASSRTCKRPLTSVIDVSPDVLLVPWVRALSTAVFDVFVELTFGCDASADLFRPLAGKIRSAPCSKMLWVLRQPSRLIRTRTERMLTIQARKAELVLCGYFSRLRRSFFLESLTSPNRMLWFTKYARWVIILWTLRLLTNTRWLRAGREYFRRHCGLYCTTAVSVFWFAPERSGFHAIITLGAFFQPVVEIQQCWANQVLFHSVQWPWFI